MARKKGGKAPLSTVQRFELFAKRVRELNNLRLIKSGMQWNFKIRWDAKSGVFQYEQAEIDEEDLRSFLLSFRKFIAPSSPIFINRIFKDCKRFLIDDKLKMEIEKARSDWNNEYRSGSMASLIFNDTNVTPEYALDLWINGEYFHDDLDKLVELKQLLRCPIPMAHITLISSLPTLTTIIFFLGQSIELGLGSNLFNIPEGSN